MCEDIMIIPYFLRAVNSFIENLNSTETAEGAEACALKSIATNFSKVFADALGSMISSIREKSTNI